MINIFCVQVAFSSRKYLLLIKREVKMTFFSFSSVCMNLDVVEVHKQKRSRPTLSHLDQANLVNKEIDMSHKEHHDMSHKEHHFLRDKLSRTVYRQIITLLWIRALLFFYRQDRYLQNVTHYKLDILIDAILYWKVQGLITSDHVSVTFILPACGKYRILHGKCARTVFTHELWRIRNRTSKRSERVRFLIQNECVNTVQSTFHVVLCLLYTYWDWTPFLKCHYDQILDIHFFKFSYTIGLS